MSAIKRTHVFLSQVGYDAIAAFIATVMVCGSVGGYLYLNGRPRWQLFSANTQSLTRAEYTEQVRRIVERGHSQFQAIAEAGNVDEVEKHRRMSVMLADASDKLVGLRTTANYSDTRSVALAIAGQWRTAAMYFSEAYDARDRATAHTMAAYGVVAFQRGLMGYALLGAE